MNLEEILPFLIPLLIVDVILFVITLRHILTHDHYKRGKRGMWIAIVLIGNQLFGPLLYFMLGKEDD